MVGAMAISTQQHVENAYGFLTTVDSPSHGLFGGYLIVDLEGRPLERVATGFHARVVQHECDHLDGVLYPMRVRDFARFGYTEVLFPELAGQQDD